MSRKAYLITRSVVAIGAFAAFFWLFLTPPTIQSKENVVYSGCHPVGWNFNGDRRLIGDDPFDVESPTEIQEYVDQTSGYRSEAKPSDDVKKRIHQACKEARHERGIVIIAVAVLFGAAFVSIPKPKPSNGGGTRSGGLNRRTRSGGLNNDPSRDERGAEPSGNEFGSELSDAGQRPERSIPEQAAGESSKPIGDGSRFKPLSNEPTS